MGSWVTRTTSVLLALAACPRRGLRRVVGLGQLTLAVSACRGSQTQGPPPGVSTADTTSSSQPSYELDSLDQRHVSAAAFAGKPVVLAFITTYDPMSQLQLNVMQPLVAEFPNVQFALVALQDASARELVELYRDTMKVTFPVALADPAIIAGGGPFGDVHAVPTLLVIGSDGTVLWRHTGPVRETELRSRIESAVKRGR